MDTDDLHLQLSQRSNLPFYAQIAEQLATAIRSGAVPAGTKLPSVRALAKQLLVSVITVSKAYETLASDALIETRQGSGTFVRDVSTGAARTATQDHARAALTDAVGEARRAGLAPTTIRTVVDDALGGPDDR